MDDKEGIADCADLRQPGMVCAGCEKVPQFIEMNDGRPRDFQFAGEGAGASGGEFLPG
jgi:hypothetical protein